MYPRATQPSHGPVDLPRGPFIIPFRTRPPTDSYHYTRYTRTRAALSRFGSVRSTRATPTAAGQLLRKARETFQEARDVFAAVLAMPQSLLPCSARAKPLLGHLESSLELGDQAAARAALEQLRALGLLQGLLDGREELRTAVRAFLTSESDAARAAA